MGLDITAYRKIEKIDTKIFSRDGEPVDADGKEVDFDLRAHANRDFPGRNGSVEDGCFYRAADSMGFRAGSYGGYNAWREELARVAGWPETTIKKYATVYPSCAASAWNAQGGPFWELINFSDCEGVIGPEVSKKLLADFEKFDGAAQISTFHGFYETYQTWRTAFEMASDAGAVSFH